MSWPKEAEAYLNTLCAQVRWKRARALIRQEYGDHIQDRAAANQAAGMEEGPAYEEALRSLGDAQQTGLLLDASYQPQLSWPLLAITAALLGAGLLLRALALNQPMDMQQLLALGLGLGGFLLLYHADWGLLLRFRWLLYGLLAAGACLYGIHTRGLWSGSPLYRSALLVSAQPSLLLLFPAVYGLLLYGCRGKGYKALLLCGLALLLPAGFLALSTAYAASLQLLLPSLVLLTLALFSGHFALNKWKGLAIIWGGALAGGLLLLASLPAYQALRLQVLLQPSLDPEGAGALSLALGEMLAGARLLGPGSVGAYSGAYLEGLAQLQAAYGGPSYNSLTMDYALAFLIHRYGWWVGLLLLGALGGLFYCLFRGCRRQSGSLARLLAYGLTLTLLWEFAAYILANLLGLPLTILPLPFLTYGNSALCINLAMLGLLTAILAGGDIQEAWACRAEGGKGAPLQRGLL